MSVSNGAARRTISSSSSTVNRSADRHRDQLLGEDVERVARQRSSARSTPSCMPFTTTAVSRRSPRYLGKITPLRRLADLVPGAADPLEAARDGGGALDLDHEVDGAHVDAELEAARRDEGGEAAGLELLLDLEALLPRDAAVVGADELLAGELVEALGEALGEAAAVGEHDRAAVARGSARRIRGWIAGQMLVRSSPPRTGPPGCSSIGRTSPSRAMSSTGTTTWSSSGLRVPASTMLTSRPSPMPPRYRAMVSSGRWVALRPMRWMRLAAVAVRSPPSAQALEAFEAQREVGAALGPGDRVDLVDDHVLDALEDLARLAGEQEVEALGGRDEDVRRVADEVAALVGGRVAGPRWRSRCCGGCVAEARRPRGRCRRAGRGGCARRRRSAP